MPEMTDWKSIHVISICSRKHQNVWKLTSSLLQKHVKAGRYSVYVPREEIVFFRSITPPAIEVLPQEDLGMEFSGRLLEAITEKENEPRYGWYLQQFYKIQALIESQSKFVAIWDADCVPTRDVHLIDSAGNPTYMNASKELHTPYFENIQRLLGMERIQRQTFVIPGFPMKKQWVNEFVSFVEERLNAPWHTAIIESTDLSLPSGFSETETLGTWVVNKYPDQWSSHEGTWERFGQSRFGYAKKFTPESIERIGAKSDLDIITFENWDVRGIRRAVRLLKRIRNRAR
jgi:hypothetical protein